LDDDAIEKVGASPTLAVGVRQMEVIEIALIGGDDAGVAKYAIPRLQRLPIPCPTAIVRRVDVVENGAGDDQVRVPGVDGDARLAGLVALAVPFVNPYVVRGPLAENG
jgi:hypothetical protein